MKLAGTVDIAAPRDRLWAALNDPGTLARCIEGVERLDLVPGDVPTFDGVMNAKVGPVRAKFAGQVRLEDIVAPERYRLVGEGKGGVAGFAKGGADVALAVIDAGTTRLDYTVDAQVGGKLAQLGARLIEGTAKQYADAFFARLKAEVEGEMAPASDAPAAAPAAATTVAPAPAPAPAGAGLSPLLWGGGLMLAVLAFLWWQWQ